MHVTIGDLSNGADAAPADAAPEYTPAVPIRFSVKPDYIISLIDGRKLKSLKRHLSTHGLTPGEYRERYGLKPDYPMVAAYYSAHRREVAQKLGRGRVGDDAHRTESSTGQTRRYVGAAHRGEAESSAQARARTRRRSAAARRKPTRPSPSG